MAFLYLCKACEEGRHGACDLCTPAPEGVYGGSICTCPCRGNPRWNSPEFLKEELKKVIDDYLHHQKAVEEHMQRQRVQRELEQRELKLKQP